MTNKLLKINYFTVIVIGDQKETPHIVDFVIETRFKTLD